ncbi:MAG: hypothetical protein K5931_07075 [Lachnospiraceae bacterium]|nr:hypothetical protein [Lachnospiraceae bacterium]
MADRKEYYEKWKTDYDFKTVIGALKSLMITIIFALYNGFLSIHHSSLWYGAIFVYYIILAILRGLIIVSEKRISGSDKREEQIIKIYIIASVLLLLLNISLIVPVTIMSKFQKPLEMTLVPAIAMAAYTLYKVVMSSIHFKKRNISSDMLVKLIRVINFIDALVSVLVLQNTLIMIKSQGDKTDMLPLTAFTGAVVLLVALAFSLSALWTGIRNLNDKKEGSPL